jgi:hypothetical protein
MSAIAVTDPTLLSELLQYEGTVELKAPDGRLLGQFTAEGFFKLPPGAKSPFTDEQLVDLRKQRDGRPLADILRDLKERT